MMRLLRRATGLVPIDVTSSPAPRLGPAVDVPPAPARPPRTQDDVGEVDRPAFPSVDLLGTCYHDMHVEFDGERLGILIRPDSSTTALRCPFTNREGI